MRTEVELIYFVSIRSVPSLREETITNDYWFRTLVNSSYWNFGEFSSYYFDQPKIFISKLTKRNRYPEDKYQATNP